MKPKSFWKMDNKILIECLEWLNAASYSVKIEREVGLPLVFIADHTNDAWRRVEKMCEVGLSKNLNQRLLNLGFRLGGCRWIDTGNGVRELFEHDVNDLSVYFSWLPDGSHPSTIGVATAWLRSFEKIGISFHIWGAIGADGNPKYYPEHDLYKTEKGYSSELEALVEFGEWANEEGLMS